MTLERGAQVRTRSKLCRSAPVSMVALTIGVMRPSPKYALGVRLRRIVLELGVLAEERELHFAGGAVALLGDDDVRDALARGVGLVHFFAVDQQNDVCILLERARVVR